MADKEDLFVAHFTTRLGNLGHGQPNRKTLQVEWTLKDVDHDGLRHDPLMKAAVGLHPQIGAPLVPQSTISQQCASSKTDAGTQRHASPRLGAKQKAYRRWRNLEEWL